MSNQQWGTLYDGLQQAPEVDHKSVLAGVSTLFKQELAQVDTKIEERPNPLRPRIIDAYIKSVLFPLSAKLSNNQGVGADVRAELLD